MARLGEDYGAFMGQIVADSYYHIEGAGPGRLVTGVVVIDVGRGPDLGLAPPPASGAYKESDFIWRYLAKRPRGATVKEICEAIGLGRSAYNTLDVDPRFEKLPGATNPAKWGVVRDIE